MVVKPEFISIVFTNEWINDAWSLDRLLSTSKTFLMNCTLYPFDLIKLCEVQELFYVKGRFRFARKKRDEPVCPVVSI